MRSSDLVKHNKQVYNEIAVYFSDSRNDLWEDLEVFRSFIRDGYSILDIGSGNGRVYQLCDKNQGINYTGIDQSEKLVDIARARVPGARFMVADMRSLPFEDRIFDLALSVASFHHLPNTEDRRKTLSEIYRILRPGGMLLMTNWNMYSDSARKNVEKGKWTLEESKTDFIVPWLDASGKILGERYYHGFTLDELRALIVDAGFVLKEHYFIRKGTPSDKEKGNNIISIAQKSLS
ncbi:MAG: class I SAM-dependent methyltransferase [Candidatus Magasanikbacteria bacterium]|nr:class I SAM-dependent methyltransferase [Candidatus Magasanikbacteria bacterium]